MATRTAGGSKKLSPIHPGRILDEEFLRPMRVTQYRLARTIGVDPRRVHAIVRGERAITAETALLFSRFFGNSAKFWMGLQSQYDLEREHDRLADRIECIPKYIPWRTPKRPSSASARTRMRDTVLKASPEGLHCAPRNVP